MRLVVVVKQDSTYKKIQQKFSSYEILPNMPIFIELQEFVISLNDESTIAIIDENIHWKNKAEILLSKYDVPYVIFSGNFNELEEQINMRHFSNGSLNLSTEQAEINEPVQEAGLGKEIDEVTDKSAVTGGFTPEVVYVDREVIREVPKFIDREVIKEIPVEKRVEVKVEVPVVVEKLVEVPVEVKVEVPVDRPVSVHHFSTMTKQLIVVGSLYGGAGSSFISAALAKVLDSLRVDTCVVEFPRNEPYLYVSLDGSTHMPRNYTYIFPQVIQGLDIKNRPEEWREGFITWMPSDPSIGRLEEWTAEHMARCLYGIKNAVTILDISTSWDDPALTDVILQADHALLVAGPEPARLLSSESRKNKQYIKKKFDSKVKVIANFAPDVPNVKTKEWINSLPAHTIARVPGLPNSDIVAASWEGRSVFHNNAALLTKFTDLLFPLVRQILPKDYILQNQKDKGIINRLKNRIGVRAR